MKDDEKAGIGAGHADHVAGKGVDGEGKAAKGVDAEVEGGGANCNPLVAHGNGLIGIRIMEKKYGNGMERGNIKK